MGLGRPSHGYGCEALTCRTCGGENVLCSGCTCGLAHLLTAIEPKAKRASGQCAWVDVVARPELSSVPVSEVPAAQDSQPLGPCRADLRRQIMEAWLDYEVTPDLTFTAPSFFRWLCEYRPAIVEAGATPEDVQEVLRSALRRYAAMR